MRDVSVKHLYMQNFKDIVLVNYTTMRAYYLHVQSLSSNKVGGESEILSIWQKQ